MANQADSKITAHERRLIAVVAAVGEASVKRYLAGLQIGELQRIRIEAAVQVLSDRGAIPGTTPPAA